MEELERMLHSVSSRKSSSICNPKKHTSKKSQIRQILLLQRQSRTSLHHLKNFQEEQKNHPINLPASLHRQTSQHYLILCLSTDPQDRTSDQTAAACKILTQQKVFGEMGNDHKVMSLLSQYIKIDIKQAGELIYKEKEKHEEIIKILEGMVQISGGQDSQDCDIESGKTVKAKFDYLEPYEGFNSIKKYSAKAVTQCCLLCIPYEQYERAMNVYKNQKGTIKMLKKTSNFMGFSLKELQCLIDECQQVTVVHNQILFRQGSATFSYCQQVSQADKTANNFQAAELRMMFFIVEGEISISKKYKNKIQPLCTLSQGNFVGDEAVFLTDHPIRQYTATVSSLRAKIIPISNRAIQQWIKAKSLGINYEIFVLGGRKSVRQKLLHYQNFHNQSQLIKSSIFTHAASKNLSEHKRQQLKNISNIAGQICQKVEGMEKINAKRLNFKTSSNQVSFEEPLFTRKDFPCFETYLKRFENQEKKAYESFKKGRSLHQ